jgi:hypothetical protein
MQNRCLVLCLLLAGVCAEAKPYRYYIQPERAEETLAGISLNPPTSTQKWLEILGSKKDQSYEVQAGDSLWRIAGKVTGNPRYWPKLWQVNSLLSNPHEISTGQILSYYREGSEPSAREIPLIRLIPNKPGAVNDLESDSIVNVAIKNQFRPSFMLISEEEILAEVTGASGFGEWVGELENVFVRFPDPESVGLNQHYTVVRVERGVVDKTTSGGGFLGTLVRLVGELEVVSKGEAIQKAVVKRHSGVIRRGDKLIALRAPVEHFPILFPPSDAAPRVVMGENEGADFFTQGQIVLLNQGENTGIKPGFLFRVLIDEDLYTKKKETVSPDFKAEVQVVFAGALSSIGLILRSSAPIGVGDLLLPAQAFVDLPKPPRKEVQVFGVD